MAAKRHTLKCFVASAFEREDVDLIFDKVVKPVLAGEGMRPLRVDRLEHNDDIDDKILDLIDRCDFAIADLTYARPSVYYEAGRVSGLGKPVIYMARGDHLRPNSDDPAGNLRVHFDLQMKNIIPWTRPVPSLHKKLASRVRHVTRPLISEKNRLEALKVQGELFNSLSWVDRAKAIEMRIREALRTAGYRLVDRDPGPAAMGYRVTDGGTDIVTVYIGQTLEQWRLQRLVGDISTYNTKLEISKAAPGKLPPVRACDLVCFTSRPIPPSRVMAVCPDFYQLEARELYRDPAPKTNPARASSLHTLCPKSYADLDRLLLTHVAELGARGIA